MIGSNRQWSSTNQGLVIIDLVLKQCRKHERDLPSARFSRLEHLDGYTLSFIASNPGVNSKVLANYRIASAVRRNKVVCVGA